MSYLGIDVSEWQGKIDFDKVKNAGYDFVMVRAGFGNKTADAYYEQNVYNANKSGLHVGAYYFVYAKNIQEAINNADNFIKLLSKFKGKIDYPVVCDFEYDSVDYMKECGVVPTKQLMTDIVNTFCDRVEKAGYYTMVYLNPDFISRLGDVSRYALWLAHWGVSKPSRDCKIWQYTSKGSVSGISGNVDLDISYEDFPKLLREYNLNFLNNSQPTPEPKPDTEIKVGDKVKVTEPYIYGTNKKFTLWYDVYDVIEVVGDRAVIGIGHVVTAPINTKYLVKVN